MSIASDIPIHSFNNYPYGAFPDANVVFDSAGNLYGTTSDGGTYGQGTVFEISPTAKGQWVEKILYSFTGLTDGCHPASGVVFDSVGNLYGTTEYGGSSDQYGLSSCYGGVLGGAGVVFKLSPGGAGNWTESVLHSFYSSDSDGYYPIAGVIFDKAGNLYGSTPGGGLGGGPVSSMN